MRGQVIVLILISATRLLCQDVEIIASKDSLTIKSPNIATHLSFDFGKSPLNHLMKLNPKISIQTIENYHVENKVDTIFTLSIGKDKFVIYKVDEEINILLDAEIITTKFKTKQGIRVGMKKQDVLKFFTSYGVKSIPNFLILENLEYPEFVTFQFNKDTLIRIVFDGYID